MWEEGHMNDNYEVFLSYSSDVDPHIFDEIVRYFEPSIYHFSRDSNEFGEKKVLKAKIAERTRRNCRRVDRPEFRSQSPSSGLLCSGCHIARSVSKRIANARYEP